MKKRGICLLLALLMTLSLLPFGALAASADDLKYTIIDGAVTITGCTNARGELVIPAAIEGRPVRAIGASAFDGCAYLTAVVIPEGVTTIGTRAFANCERMERVNLPTTLQSIGTGAFLACVSLKSVTIPEGLKTLSPYAFSVCEGLERVTIPEGVSVIQHEAFYGCSGLKEVTIPGSVSTVETLAFSACRKLTEVTFRGAAAKLEDDVFLDCTGLKHVFYPGTAQQWQTAGGEFAGLNGKTFLHCGVADSKNHVQTTHFDPSPAQPGYDAWSCPCGYSEISSDIVYVSEDGLKATIAAGEARTDLRFVGEAYQPENDRLDAALRSQSGRNVLHFFHAYFLETDADGKEALFLPQGRVMIALPAPDDVFPNSMRAFAVRTRLDDSFETGEIPMTLSEDGSAILLTVNEPRDFCIAGNSNAHVHQLTAIDRVAPTCTEPGTEAYWECAECGMRFSDAAGKNAISEPAVIPASGHHYEIQNAREASCTAPGYTGDEICSVCGQAGAMGREIPPTEHETELKNAKAATCSEPGYTGDEICKTCGKVVSVGRDIPMLAHETELRNAKDATCTAAGYTGDLVCKVCGKVVAKGEEIPMLDHETELRNVKDATCSEPGYTGDRICKHCGKVVSVGKEIPMLDHESELKNAKDATCTEPGYTGDRICKNCGKVVSKGKEIPMLDHETELKNAKAATCAAPGYTGDQVCKNCGKVVTQGEEIPALAHETDLKNAKAATCTSPGYTGDQICKICGKIVAQGREIPALDHEAELKNAAAPTCTRQGYSGDQICRHCGKVIAVGEAIPAAGHKAELRNAVKASCTEPGYTGDEVCSVCGETLKKGDVIPAKGHVWGDWKVTKPATVDAEGQEMRICTACGDTETRAIPKVIPTEPDNPFTDVKEGAYYYDAVLWAVKHDPQIAQGTSETLFSPDAACTRGQIVTFLWRAKGCPEPKSTTNPFVDVKPGDYFFKAVLWAVEQGVTNGVGADRFDPNGSCTRGQAVTFLWRAEGKPAPKAQSSGFSDVQNPNDYYYVPVLWAVENGIAAGTGGGLFSPELSCTRGQIVTFLYRDMNP